MKQDRKVALINVADYPKEEYFAYWEIRVDGDDENGYGYGVRIYHRDTGEVLQDIEGDAPTRDEVDALAQQWVLDRFELFRRAEA